MKEISYESPPEKKPKVWEQPMERSKGSKDAPTLRTFRTDVSDLVTETGLTKTQIVMAEQSRRESRGQSREAHEDDSPHLWRIIFGLLLILAFGIGVGIYVLIGTKIPALGGTTGGTEAPLSVDPTSVTITNSPREQVLADILIAFGNTRLESGGTRMVTFLSRSNDGSTKEVTASELLTVLAQKPPPQSLLLSLDDAATFNIYALPELTGYITLSSRSYPNSLAGMLAWEPAMAKDLVPALLPRFARKDLKLLDGRAFHDERIDTIDARTLRDPDGNSFLAYTFIDQKTLLIAGNVETLRSIVKTLKPATAK